MVLRKQNASGFKFSCLTRLLWELEKLALKEPNRSKVNSKTKEWVADWFETYRTDIQDWTTLSAIMSSFLPELRPDRTYMMREDTLAKILIRIMFLGSARQRVLLDWRKSTKEGDLGSAVEKIMKQTPFCEEGTITVEEIDTMLDELAGRCRFSTEELRKKYKATSGRTPQEIIESIWMRLTPYEGKWLTRCILKKLDPVVISSSLVLKSYHFLMPRLLTVQDNLVQACKHICSDEVKIIPHHPKQHHEHRFIAISNLLLKPEIGVKVGRGEFIKASSCDHVIKLANLRTMAMERKYDGEYCQIHIDVRNGRELIKIFSKSGRDSTQDRKEIHSTLRAALKLSSNEERGFKKTCIIEGELVVYNKRKKDIMPFFNIRQHVTRAGNHIGTAGDYPPDRDSHLMILLFDVLLFDEKSLLHRPYSERMAYLYKVLVTPMIGHCELVQTSIIDFSRPSIAHGQLREYFAKGILKRWEGFILKACDSPYIDPECDKIDKTTRGHGFLGGKHAWIKLKKDYIEGLGDTADFCIVGGTADSGRTCTRGLSAGSLSVFHAAVLVNKEDVKKYGSTPKLQVVFEVTYSISKPDLQWIQTVASHDAIEFEENVQPGDYELSFTPNLPMRKPSHIFKKPLIFEVTGGGFDKQTDCGFFTPRHPRVSKIHWDREFTDSVSFDELQELAKEAINTQQADSQKERLWIAALERGDRGQLEQSMRSDQSEETPVSKSLSMSFTPSSTPRGIGQSEATSAFTRPIAVNRSESMMVPRTRACTPPLTRSITCPTTATITPLKSPGSPLPETQANAQLLSPAPTSPLAPPKFSLPPSSPPKRSLPPSSPPKCSLPPSSPPKFSLPKSPPETSPPPEPSSPKKRKRFQEQNNTSPLIGANVFLMPSLCKFPKIYENLSTHDVEMIRLLPLNNDGVLADDFQVVPDKRNIVLVETMAKERTRRVLRSLSDHENKRIAAGLSPSENTWEIYDWRVCKTPLEKTTPKERGMWDTWKVFEI
ncbi:hypothetical protein EDC01DRAFT_667337 [Geopyxis carbonaria]|nr:hypothetical protein EDC01DRAFT_667337 [Geopyxis carbonaria]